MDKFEAYSFLFLDELLGTLLITPHAVYVKYVMNIFGNYDRNYIYFFSLLGILVASMLNFYIGVFINKALVTHIENNKADVYGKLQNYLNKYSIVFAFMCVIPHLGAAFMVAFGFFKYNFLRYISLMALLFSFANII